MRARLVAFFRFVGAVFAKGHRDEVVLRSSALAFSTLISFVPLLAGVSIFAARTLREDDGRILELLARLLPYREETILAALRSFLAQAESVSGVAIAGFVVTALLTFFGVQESLFQIFGVARPPSLLRRLSTFSLLFVWGPLVVGTAQTALLVVGQSNPELARVLRATPLVGSAPVLLTFVGLTMLYWRAAFRRISLRHAAVGGAVAALSLELLKIVFGVYAREFTEVQLAVYGSFAIALFFVLSIQLAWWLLLLGAEVAACLAPHVAAARIAPATATTPDVWTGFAALELLARPGRPRRAIEELAGALARPADVVARDLAPLVDCGLLEPGAGEQEGYRLALPTRQVRVAAVLAAYRRQLEATPAPPAVTIAPDLRSRLTRAAEFEVGEQTLADLFDVGPDDTLAAGETARHAGREA
jgi:membrane protein